MSAISRRCHPKKLVDNISVFRMVAYKMVFDFGTKPFDMYIPSSDTKLMARTTNH